MRAARPSARFVRRFDPMRDGVRGRPVCLPDELAGDARAALEVALRKERCVAAAAAATAPCLPIHWRNNSEAWRRGRSGLPAGIRPIRSEWVQCGYAAPRRGGSALL